MATMSKRLAYRMSGQSKGAPRDENTAIIVFWKLVGGLVGGLALVLLVMNLLGEISFRRGSDPAATRRVYQGQGPTVQEQQQNYNAQPSNAERSSEVPAGPTQEAPSK